MVVPVAVAGLAGSAAGAGVAAGAGAAAGFFATYGGALAATLGQALLFGSRSKFGAAGIRRHQQIHTAQSQSLGTVSSPQGPPPVHWGHRPRQVAPLMYLDTTRVDTTVKSVTTSGQTTDQPARDKHYHAAYLLSLGAINRIRGLWIDGEYHRLEWVDADDGEGRKAALPYNGVIREYVRGDGTQGGALRRHTLSLAPMNRRWLESDKVTGYSWCYLRFVAKAAGAERDPQTGELVQASLLPHIDVERWPLIEFDFEGRLVRIPNGPDPATWTWGYTDEYAAVLYDRLDLMGWSSYCDGRAFWESHRVGAQQIRINLPPAGTTRGQRRWLQAAEKPATPVIFDPGAPWQANEPAEDAAAGMSWWLTVRAGSDPAAQFYWTDPVVWVRPRSASSAAGAQGGQNLMHVASPFGAGGPDITIPPIELPDEDDDDPIVITPPPGTADPEDDYRTRYEDGGEGITIRYPVSVGATTEELTEQGLADYLQRTALNWQGNLLWDGGRLRPRAGYAKAPIGDLVDGRDCTITAFESSAPAREQWNAFALTMLQAGADAGEQEVVEVEDGARILREGRKVKLDMGAQPYFANRLNATMALTKAAVRQRYQRRGTLIVPPDTDLEWASTARAGERVRLRSARLGLESYRLSERGKISRQEHTTVLLKSVTERADRALVCTWTEDPSIIWHDWFGFPGLDPDVSEPGVFVEQPRNLRLEEVFRPQSAGHLHYLHGAWDSSSEPRALFQWRPVIPAGADPLTLEVDGVARELSATPDWGIFERVVERQASLNFASGLLAIGYQVEARVAFISGRGTLGPWSAVASLTVLGPRTVPDALLGLTAYPAERGYWATWFPIENPLLLHFEVWDKPGNPGDPGTDVVIDDTWTRRGIVTGNEFRRRDVPEDALDQRLRVAVRTVSIAGLPGAAREVGVVPGSGVVSGALPPPTPVTVAATAGTTPPPGISGGMGQWSIGRITFPEVPGAIGYRIVWTEHWSNGDVDYWSTDESTARNGNVFRAINRGNDDYIERWTVRVHTLAPGHVEGLPSLVAVSGPGPTVRVAANSSTTVGGAPPAADGTTPATTGTDAPGSARTAVGDGEVVFAWDEVENATAYRAQYREVGTVRWLEAEGEVCCEVTVEDLDNGTEYEFRVQVASPTEGDWTVPVRATPGLVALAQVTGMAGVNPSFGHVTISWNALANAAGYELQYGEQDVGFTFAEDITSGSSFSSTDALRRTFIFRCRAYLDVAGERQYGPWSATLVFTVLQGRAGPPTAPRNLRVSFRD